MKLTLWSWPGISFIPGDLSVPSQPLSWVRASGCHSLLQPWSSRGSQEVSWGTACSHWMGDLTSHHMRSTIGASFMFALLSFQVRIYLKKRLGAKDIEGIKWRLKKIKILKSLEARPSLIYLPGERGLAGYCSGDWFSTMWARVVWIDAIIAACQESWEKINCDFDFRSATQAIAHQTVYIIQAFKLIFQRTSKITISIFL